MRAMLPLQFTSCKGSFPGTECKTYGQLVYSTHMKAAPAGVASRDVV